MIMNNTAFEELSALAAQNSNNCLTEELIINHADNMGLSILEISKLCDRLVDEGIKIVSQSDYDKAVSDYKQKQKQEQDDPIIEQIVRLFRSLSPEKQELCRNRLFEAENNVPYRSTEILKFIERLKNTRLLYSYIAVIVKSFFELHSNDGSVPLDELISKFGDFYIDRINKGLVAEKSNSLVCKGELSFDDFKYIVLSNPLKRSFLIDYFTVDKKNGVVRMNDNFSSNLNERDAKKILSIVEEKLEEYYSII